MIIPPQAPPDKIGINSGDVKNGILGFIGIK